MNPTRIRMHAFHTSKYFMKLYENDSKNYCINSTEKKSISHKCWNKTSQLQASSAEMKQYEMNNATKTVGGKKNK